MSCLIQHHIIYIYILYYLRLITHYQIESWFSNEVTVNKHQENEHVLLVQLKFRPLSPHAIKFATNESSSYIALSRSISFS